MYKIYVPSVALIYVGILASISLHKPFCIVYFQFEPHNHHKYIIVIIPIVDS